MKKPATIHPAEGRLGVLLPGLGAVATTAIAGVMLARRGLADPIGSLTQMGTIRLGPRKAARSPRIAELVPLAKMEDLVFGGWDVFPDDAYESARAADVLGRDHLDAVEDELRRVKPMPAVFDPAYVRRLQGPHVKRGRTKADLVEQVRADIQEHRRTQAYTRAVAVWCGSTEVYLEPGAVHQSIDAFENGLRRNDPRNLLRLRPSPSPLR